MDVRFDWPDVEEDARMRRTLPVEYALRTDVDCRNRRNLAEEWKRQILVTNRKPVAEASASAYSPGRVIRIQTS
jgi:hypothetical protein